MVDVTPVPSEHALPAPETKGNALLGHLGFLVEEWYND
jgi:hypothetical protein